ncbi:MAG: hypothetical protein WC440_01700, partial [Candidatus Omnitrophota bacterium]
GCILEAIKFGLFVNKEYQKFFCGYQEGDFPAEFKQWQDLPLDNPQARLFGLKRTASLPALTFANNAGLNCIIQNSDFEMSCRTLQLSLSGERFSSPAREYHFKAQLNLLEDGCQVELYQRSEMEKFLSSRTVYSARARVFADLKNKRIRVFYQDKEITRGRGLYATVFFAGDQTWFNSFDNDTQWEINKISSGKMELRISHNRFVNFSFKWELELKKNDLLEVRVLVKSEQECSVIYRDLRLELSGEYKSWKTAYEEGNFSIKNYIHGLAPVRLKNSKVSGLILEPLDKNSISNLSFFVSSQAEKSLLNIFKRLELQDEYLVLSFSTIVPRNKQALPAGESIFFEGGIALGEKIGLGVSLKNRIILNKQDLKLVFDRGRTAILYKGKELTQDLGAYTSVRCASVWYDSSQAVWDISKSDLKSIIAVGSWPSVPILQSWHLELKGENSIYWKVDLEAYEEVFLEIEQANLMLSGAYDSWLIPEANKGKFIDEYTAEYDILPFRFWYGKSSEITARALNLPKVSFRNNLKGSGLRAVVENTDSLYRARLLQFQKSNPAALGVKKYRYFEGVIKIG